jgi:hypothetical protein
MRTKTEFWKTRGENILQTNKCNMRVDGERNGNGLGN